MEARENFSIEDDSADADRAGNQQDVDLSGVQEGLTLARLGEPDAHAHLMAIAIRKPSDFEPYGYRVRDDSDCSCGCRWFLPLQCQPYDWGVCSNPLSPRCGLLTFEHMGCPQFETGDLIDEQKSIP